MKNHDDTGGGAGVKPHLSMFGAWAFAFGCALGLDMFDLPGTSFLPVAGPVGTALGIGIGLVAMLALAWNYHFMMGRFRDDGGAYSFAGKVFGRDHGFLCGWFLVLAYGSIVWMDSLALNGLAHYAFGGFFERGPKWSVGGHDVWLAQALLSSAALFAATAICRRPRLAARVQTAMALVFVFGIAASFAAALRSYAAEGGIVGPAFATVESGPPRQVMRILIQALWLFVGFESVSHHVSEFKFPVRKTFGVMSAALVAAAACYIMATLVPVFAPGGAATWRRLLLASAAGGGFDGLAVAGRPLGALARPLLGAAGIGAVFTNLVGNSAAIARLLAAMSSDGAFRPWLSRRNRAGAPVAALWAIFAVSFLVPALGSGVIGLVVDIAVLGAAVSYGYTSAAVLKLARAAGDLRSCVTGALCLFLSVLVSVVFVFPVFSGSITTLATESYFILVVWCILGLAVFLIAAWRDGGRRFGRSPVAWTSIVAVVLVLTMLWTRQTVNDVSEKTFGEISALHYHGDAAGRPVPRDDRWTGELRRIRRSSDSVLIGSGFAQSGIVLLALALMTGLHYILRKRELEAEKEKARAKSYFFSTVSHDIRTPLNAIIGFSELLKTGKQTEEQREQAVDSILVSGKTLLALVNDILDLSKLESGKMEMLPEPTDLPALLRSVAEAFRAAGVKSGVEIRCRAGDMPPLMLDPQRVRQIVFNLVGNAMKFTEKGHVELRAFFVAPGKPGGGTLRIDVSDTGCGISGENLKRLGSAYVQVGGSRGRNGGTGLGLAICKQLAAAMGGRLEVASELGSGSVFSLLVPKVEVAAEAPGTGGAAAGAGDAAESGTPGAAAAALPARILLVDDTKLNLMVLVAMLGHEGGFEIELAENGRKALEALRAPGAKPFDLVLTDLWMPELDGAGLVKAIRADPALAALRVVAVTADVEFREKYAAAGFDGLLLKPVTGAKLRAVLLGSPS